ncbi:helix-turn-helix domain-containing protein [Paenibacillus sp. FSL P4-0176]|uniref:helix-turn-helix domain-containing protein n=1 Tax=Paenibacillus sp. FSL P4-0176 TaxID=2921631 RepID=UPI0030D55F80
MQTFSLNNQLGELLKELRSKKGWSLRKAGEESGVSYSYISMLEKGLHSSTEKNSKVSPEQLKKLADAYEYPYNMLMIKAGYTESDLNESSLIEEPQYFNENPYIVKESISNTYNINNFEKDELYYKSLEDIVIKEQVYEWRVASNIKTETIGQRLVDLREKRKLTINELSEQLVIRIEKTGFTSYKKYPPSVLIDIETDKTEPTSSFLIAVSEFYSVSFDFLLTGYDKLESLDLEEENELEWEDKKYTYDDKYLPCSNDEVDNLLKTYSNKNKSNVNSMNDFLKVNYRNNYKYSINECMPKENKEFKELSSKIDILTKIVISMTQNTSIEKTKVGSLSPNIINSYQNQKKEAESRE